MTQENKVTFGLKNVHVAPIKSIGADGVIAYDEIFRFLLEVYLIFSQQRVQKECDLHHDLVQLLILSQHSN